MSTTNNDSKIGRDDKPFLEFGRYLQGLRKENGWSQAELAEQLDVTLGYYGHWEQGRAKPSPKVLLRLATKVGLDLADLMRRAQYEEEEIKKWSGIASRRADEAESEADKDGKQVPLHRVNGDAPRESPALAGGETTSNPEALSTERLDWALICIAQDPTYSLSNQFTQGGLPNNVKALVVQLYQTQTGRQLLTQGESEALQQLLQG
jgi:transcriptional regulator with XRE-family HTH domain